uniref:Uncharacterized protein n=1 Tax=Dicentrarchus labrax TaxID=13489 RepID=A0A8C4I8W0_DICLA
MPAPIIAAKLTSQDPLIIRPISAGVLLTAKADKAVIQNAVTHTAFSMAPISLDMPTRIILPMLSTVDTTIIILDTL